MRQHDKYIFTVSHVACWSLFWGNWDIPESSWRTRRLTVSGGWFSEVQLSGEILNATVVNDTGRIWYDMRYEMIPRYLIWQYDNMTWCKLQANASHTQNSLASCGVCATVISPSPFPFQSGRQKDKKLNVRNAYLTSYSTFLSKLSTVVCLVF